MTTPFAAWLSGPAVIVLGIGMTEDRDRYRIAASVKYGKIRRHPDKEGFFDAEGVPFDTIDAGVYADHLVSGQMVAFTEMANDWLQEAVRGIPNRVRLALSVEVERNDATPDGLVFAFEATGECLPDGRIQAATFEAWRDAIQQACAGV